MFSINWATTNAAARDVSTLEVGATARGTLESSDGRLDDGEYRDLYVFNGSAGQNVRVDMNSSAFDTYLGVVTPGGENIENDTRADWFYELAVVSSANKDYCEAIAYAREAIAYRSNFGKAYLTLGDAILASRDNLGDDFEKRTAFWVAADKYAKAKSVDPSVAADANKKLKDYAGQYPNHEEVFFRDLKDGDSYQVKGCINEYTTVRSSK